MSLTSIFRMACFRNRQVLKRRIKDLCFSWAIQAEIDNNYNSRVMNRSLCLINNKMEAHAIGGTSHVTSKQFRFELQWLSGGYDIPAGCDLMLLIYMSHELYNLVLVKILRLVDINEKIRRHIWRNPLSWKVYSWSSRVLPGPYLVKHVLWERRYYRSRVLMLTV